MTPRRLRVLIQHLPPESATMTALRNALSEEERERLAAEAQPEQGRWSQAEHLLATVADRVARLTYITTLAHSDRGSRVKEPEPIPRPGVAAAGRPKRKRKPLTEADAERLLTLIHGGAESA